MPLHIAYPETAMHTTTRTYLIQLEDEDEEDDGEEGESGV
jgi:hypothetical protein